MIDTGSAASFVRKDIATHLALPPSGWDSISHAADGRSVDCFATTGDVVLHGKSRTVWTVTWRLLVPPGKMAGGLGLILGMDFLAEGRLTVDFALGEWSFVIRTASGSRGD